MTSFTHQTAHGPVRLEFDWREGEVSVAGESYPCDGRFVWLDGRRVPFWVHRAGDKVSVWLDGEVYHFHHHDPRQRREDAGGAFSDQVQAQMPGKVLSLAVKPGDNVTQGQNLLVMESMKMELALDAPRDGKVESVEVQVGQLVTQGQVLIRLEA